MQLDTFIQYLAHDLCGLQFRHGGRNRIQFAFQVMGKAGINKGPYHNSLGFDFRKLEAGILKIRNGFTEGFSLYCIVRCPVEGGFYNRG